MRTSLLYIGVSIIIICFLTAWKVYGYTEIKIYPEHVGVFTTVGTQQFVAFGVTPSGVEVNITKEVKWLSSRSDIVTIDANGLATIHSTSGQALITAEWSDIPKHRDLCFIMILLLNQKMEYVKLIHPDFILPPEFVGQLVTPVIPAVQYPNVVEYLKRFEIKGREL